MRRIREGANRFSVFVLNREIYRGKQNCERQTLDIYEDDKMIKQRISAIIIALVSAVTLYETHYDALHNNGYYLKAAALAPLGVVAGVFLFIFPQFSGKPETAREKAAVFTVFIVGILLGLYNWHSIDPQAFKF